MRTSRRSLQVLALLCLPLFAEGAQHPGANRQAVSETGGSSLWSVKNGTYNNYLRFYSDGTVIGVSSTGTPAQIEPWFKAPYRNSGKFSLEGFSVKFSLTDAAATVDYDGVVRGSVLQLDSYSHINGVRKKLFYQLENGVAIPVPTVTRGGVEKNTQGGVVEARKDVTSGSTANAPDKKSGRPPSKSTGSAVRELSGCICGFDELKTTLKIVPWNQNEKVWDSENAKVFAYTDGTTLVGESKATVAELKGGKAVKSFHLTGFSMNGATGTPFEIKSLSACVGRRTRIHWVEEQGTTVANSIELPYLFGGESLPAMIGNQNSQVVGSDDCPCQLK